MITSAASVRISLCCALIGLSAGCSGSTTGASLKIGIVNLETVLKESGEVEKFQQKATALSQQLQNEINQYQANLNQEYEQKVAEFGATPSDEQKRVLEGMKVMRQNQLSQVNQQARMVMGNLNQDMVESFRKKIRPVVEKLSDEEKYDLIIEDSGFVIAYNKAIDVSSNVATRLKMEEMSTPSTPGAEGGLPPMGANTPPTPAPSMANDPISSMLKSPSLPVPSQPMGSTAPLTTPKTSTAVPTTPSPAQPEKTTPEPAAETKPSSEEAKPAESATTDPETKPES